MREEEYFMLSCFNDRNIEVACLLFQGDLKWLDGSLVTYQRWFYPVAGINQAKHLLRSDYNRELFKHTNNNTFSRREPISQSHKQPYNSPENKCVAAQTTGHYGLHYTNWLTINCSKIFHNISIICEQALTNSTNSSLYNQSGNNSDAVMRTGNHLTAASHYCPHHMLHIDGLCYQLWQTTHSIGAHCVKLDFESLDQQYLRSQKWKHLMMKLEDLHLLNILPEVITFCRGPPSLLIESELFGLFQCDDMTYIVDHYKCDGKIDCSDSSDEKYCDNKCLHGCSSCAVLYYKCNNGDCIPLSRFCNHVQDCSDGSDDLNCQTPHSQTIQSPNSDLLYTCNKGKVIDYRLVNDTIPDCPEDGDDEPDVSLVNEIRTEQNSLFYLPCIIAHPKQYPFHMLCTLVWDELGHISGCRNGAHLTNCINHSCPHQFKCPASYCIPVHAVCDGRQDCPYGEDEAQCDYSLTCPHMLKCKSGVCVHPYHINDGHVDCPGDGHDDEITNGISNCPESCTCSTKAIHCIHLPQYLDYNLLWSNAFSITSTKELILDSDTFKKVKRIKYLDLSKSILIYSDNSPFNVLSDVVYLDISNTSLTFIQEKFLSNLSNLYHLHLHDNVIRKISSNALVDLNSISILNFSSSSLEIINDCSFNNLKSLKELDLSHNNIKSIVSQIICGKNQLKYLNLQGNAIFYVSRFALLSVSKLEILISDITGLCCYTEARKCCPQFIDDLASCSNIIKYDFVRYLFWIIAIVSLGENVIGLAALSFFSTNFSYKTRKSIHHMYHKNLIGSDILISLYFFSLLAADLIYDGDYITNSNWKKSLFCKILSFVSLLAYEVSLIIVCILAIDRLVAVCLPFRHKWLGVKASNFIVFSSWLLCAGVCFIPMYDLHVRQKAMSNAMCSSLLDIKILHWVVTLIYIINSITVVSNCTIYIIIVRVVKAGKSSHGYSTKRRSRESSLTLRIVFLILATGCCWITVSTVAVLQILNITIRSNVFILSTVIVYATGPILNPILNVLSTKESIKLFSR